MYRARLEPNGLALTAHRADAEADFLASTDNWFRPVQFAHGPDGTLYVLDMYRELIEGAAFLPPELLAQMDPTAGCDRGRIYRILPDGFEQSAPVRLGDLKTEQLVALLGHANGWHRDTAARLLYQRQDTAAIDPLRKLAAESQFPLARLHARYALNSLEALRAEDVVAALADDHPRLREHALRLAEPFAASSSEVQKALAGLADDVDLHVRFQLAFSAGYLPPKLRDPLLVQLLARDGESHWFRMAVQSSLGQSASGVLSGLLADAKFRQAPHGKEFITTLAKQIGRANQPEDIRPTLAAIASLDDGAAGSEQLAKAIVAGLMEDRQGALSKVLEQTGGADVQKIVARLMTDARRVAVDEQQAVEARVAAIRTLGGGNFADEKEIFTQLLQPQQLQSVQEAALATLSRLDEAEVAELLLDNWSRFTPRLRSVAAEVLFSRPEWTISLLNAVEQGDVPKGDIDPARITLLKSHPDADLQKRAAQVFAGVAVALRSAVVEHYRQALKLSGDAPRGREAFRKTCAACHRLEDVGTAIGADLYAIRERGDEAILLNVLDPNREIKPQFLTYVVITTEGQSLTGMITEETPTNLTIRQPDGTPVTVARIDIEEIASTGQSYMPEGLEKQLDLQAMADLLAYLATIK